MPDLTITIPTEAAQRIGAVLDAQGFTGADPDTPGTNAEKIEEVKRRLVKFIRAWVRGHELAAAAQAAADGYVDPDLT